VIVADGVTVVEPFTDEAPKFDDWTWLAPVEDQVSVTVLPARIVVGLAVRLTVTVGGLTVTVCVAVAVPPGPETVMV